MFGSAKIKVQEQSLYATRSDFCRVFEKDINPLYRLSFVLTGDRTIAEQCFVGGLHIAQDGNHVFKEWAESWARRAIIQNAIRMIRPRKANDATNLMSVRSTAKVLAEPIEIARIADLPGFERFTFVMSVLERYSDQECSLLLGCTRGDVAAARTRALGWLGRSADLQRKLTTIRSNQKARRENSESARQLTADSSLAVSA